MPTIKDQQREIRELNAERRRLKGDPPEPTRPKRISLSQIVELILTRGAREHSSVTLTRNAKGDTQIEVAIRSGESSEFLTIDAAALKVQELYDQLRARYPLASGKTGA